MTTAVKPRVEFRTRWRSVTRTVAGVPERVQLREDMIGRVADDLDATIGPGGVLTVGATEWRLA